MPRGSHAIAKRVSAPTRQISAQVARTTSELLERFSEQTGIKKGYLVEQALLHHIAVLQELPEDAIIPPRAVAAAEAGRTLLKEIENPSEPNHELRALMSRNGH